MASPEITLEVVPSVGDVPAAQWDACANPGAEHLALNGGGAGASCVGSRPYYNPFVSHALLSAAENSGSAVARTGWGARPLIAKLDGKVAGIVPCYLKSHPQAESVLVPGWADASERAGGRYYPKLQCSV